MPTWCWEKHLYLFRYTPQKFNILSKQKQIQYLHVTSVTFLNYVVVANSTQTLIKNNNTYECVCMCLSRKVLRLEMNKKYEKVTVQIININENILPLLFLWGNRLLHLYVIGMKKRGKGITHKWKANTQKECWWERCRTRSC